MSGRGRGRAALALCGATLLWLGLFLIPLGGLVLWRAWAQQVDIGTALSGLAAWGEPAIRPVVLPDGRVCYRVPDRWRDHLVCAGADQ